MKDHSQFGERLQLAALDTFEILPRDWSALRIAIIDDRAVDGYQWEKYSPDLWLAYNEQINKLYYYRPTVAARLIDGKA